MKLLRQHTICIKLALHWRLKHTICRYIQSAPSFLGHFVRHNWRSKKLIGTTYSVVCRGTLRWGGGRFDPEHAVANSPPAWLTFDQLSDKFENIGGGTTPLHLHIPVSTYLFAEEISSSIKHRHAILSTI